MGPADNQTLVESIVKAQQSVPPSFDQHDSQLDVDEGNDVRVASTDALIVSVPLCICVYFGKGGHLIAWKTAKHDALSILKPTCFPRSLPLFFFFLCNPMSFSLPLQEVVPRWRLATLKRREEEDREEIMELEMEGDLGRRRAQRLRERQQQKDANKTKALQRQVALTQ